MLDILVVCSHNKWRSPTAENIYRHDSRFRIRSAGLGKLSPHFLSQKDLLWADLLLYMERDHLERIKTLYPGIELPKTVNLDIPDEYPFMDPELIEIIKGKIEGILATVGN